MTQPIRQITVLRSQHRYQLTQTRFRLCTARCCVNIFHRTQDPGPVTLADPRQKIAHIEFFQDCSVILRTFPVDTPCNTISTSDNISAFSLR